MTAKVPPKNETEGKKEVKYLPVKEPVKSSVDFLDLFPISETEFKKSSKK